MYEEIKAKILEELKQEQKLRDVVTGTKNEDDWTMIEILNNQKNQIDALAKGIKVAQEEKLE